MKNDKNNNILTFSTKGDGNHSLQSIKCNNDEERAVLILTILKHAKFSVEQMMDAKRFIHKWCQHYSFKSLVTELSLLMENGEQFYPFMVE